jgi:4-amino-4-deoxychorismate lyase
VNGQPAEGLSVHDRGLAYGDGLFETIRVVDGRPRLFERHLLRLQEGCRRLRLPLDQVALRAEILAFCQVLQNGAAKLIVTRGDGLRGYAPPDSCVPRRLLLGSAAPSYPEGNARDGVRLFPCSTRLAEQPLLAGLKHLNRLEQVLARAEWQDPAFAEGLLCDTSGRVVEAVFSNLFLFRAGTLVTPSLERCGVAGVMRAELLERAGEAGVPVAVRDIQLSELLQADEVFLSNSLYGVWPVREFQGHAWPIGAVTRKLQALSTEQPSAP